MSLSFKTFNIFQLVTTREWRQDSGGGSEGDGDEHPKLENRHQHREAGRQTDRETDR